MGDHAVTISVKGIVQGVGFRPFVFRLASIHGLAGWVSNSNQGVKIEIEGFKKDVDSFIDELQNNPPPLSVIDSVEIATHKARGYPGFSIRKSEDEGREITLISPDVATCSDCLREILDQEDRRFRYPFTNCTNCGPRFSIIEEIPYDRPKTTMRVFPMCPNCEAEYRNPLDRRFHAQPNACPVCGPSLRLLDRSGHVVPCDDQLHAAIDLLKRGEIVAIKGIGGFHLGCDALNEGAVSTLRMRKRRPWKPLAIMCPSVEVVRGFCQVSEAEDRLLTSPQCPIVLLSKRRDQTIPESVAPRNPRLGVMLPSTPLHHLLFRDEGLRALVMTSGNLREEPIVIDNGEAVEKLGAIADHFLVHDREIYNRNDDSVAFLLQREPIIIRRSRGFAPYPIRIGRTLRPLLACGGELKNTVCLTKGEYAFLSQHIGEMDNLESLSFFRETIDKFEKWLRVKPEIIAHDLHPDYLSTRFARQFEGLERIGVQHHHAHIVSCMSEHGLNGHVIGVAFDGTGYGSDGAIWGCEFLIASGRDFLRRGHLRYIPLPGGDTAIKKPYRTAIAHLHSSMGDEAFRLPLPLLDRVTQEEKEIILTQMERGINAPLTSSCGRLFDAVSSLLGLRDEITYEGQAAMELEARLHAVPPDAPSRGVYDFEICRQEEMLIIDPRSTIHSIVDDILNGVESGVISRRFHETVVEFTAQMCELLREESKLRSVVLSGGVFQNQYLLSHLVERLREGDFNVFYHRDIPTNDGGISLGQALIAHERCGKP